MDGYHLTRAQLSALPNPEEAHYRRGAPFTFDSAGYLKLIKNLRKPIEPGSRTTWAPSFDHYIKDPVENDISIPRTARVVIVEGLYTALCYPPSKADGSSDVEASPWTEACELLDEIWLISVPIPVATERVAKRNFKAGLSPSLEAALKRTIENDMQNAREILDNLPGEDKLTERIESIEDEGWKTEEQKQALDDEKARLEQEARTEEITRLRLERAGSIADLADAGAGM
jgi:pantothenate kinase